MLGKVTHVESYNKFFIQLDLDEAAWVESDIAKFGSQLTPLDEDYLHYNIPCMVKETEKIYRAILEDVSNKNAIIVFCPDYGFSITTTLDKLMILPKELCRYRYQSLECSLSKCAVAMKTTLLMTVEQLKEKITGKKFIIYINDIENDEIITTLYDIGTGQKVTVFEPDDDACEVVPLCPLPVFNYDFGLCNISYAENLEEIYFQKAPDVSKIVQLLVEMEKFYENGTPEPLGSLVVDGLCAAKSSDGDWYRSMIISADDEFVKVRFVDYGKLETIPKDNIKKLDPKFYEPYALAMSASLGLEEFGDDALTNLLDSLHFNEVHVTLVRGSHCWFARFHPDGVDENINLAASKACTSGHFCLQ